MKLSQDQKVKIIQSVIEGGLKLEMDGYDNNGVTACNIISLATAIIKEIEEN